MEMIVFLVLLFIVLDVAALKGWAPDTRDNRDWNVPDRTASSPSVAGSR